jgi:hypothetical protein
MQRFVYSWHRYVSEIVIFALREKLNSCVTLAHSKLLPFIEGTAVASLLVAKLVTV